MNELDNVITIVREDGSELLCEIILTNHREETGVDYVVFEMPDGEVSAAIYDPTDEETGQLSDIETEEEWDYINDVLDDYYDTLEAEEDEELEDEE